MRKKKWEKKGKKYPVVLTVQCDHKISKDVEYKEGLVNFTVHPVWL